MANDRALYVPFEEQSAAMSLGAVAVEGDARLFIPKPLPNGIHEEAFSRWQTPTSRIVWIGEYLESIVGSKIDLLDVADLLRGSDTGALNKDEHLVPLFVPRSEMNAVRAIPGVTWSKKHRRYMAERRADFWLIHRYLTPAMESLWRSEQNLDIATLAMVRSQAMIAMVDGGDEMSPRELSPVLDERLGSSD